MYACTTSGNRRLSPADTLTDYLQGTHGLKTCTGFRPTNAGNTGAFKHIVHTTSHHDTPLHHSLSVVSSVLGAVDVLDVVVQGKDVGVDVRALLPGEAVAVIRRQQQRRREAGREGTERLVSTN